MSVLLTTLGLPRAHARRQRLAASSPHLGGIPPDHTARPARDSDARPLEAACLPSSCGRLAERVGGARGMTLSVHLYLHARELTGTGLHLRAISALDAWVAGASPLMVDALANARRVAEYQVPTMWTSQRPEPSLTRVGGKAIIDHTVWASWGTVNESKLPCFPCEWWWPAEYRHRSDRPPSGTLRLRPCARNGCIWRVIQDRHPRHRETHPADARQARPILWCCVTPQASRPRTPAASNDSSVLR